MKRFISWVEIPTTNFNRAVSFYSEVFQIGLNAMEHHDEKMACFTEGEGAIIFSPGFRPSKEGVIVSLNTENEMDTVIKRIQKSGGKIVKQKTKIEAEGLGYFALFEDCEGNRLGLYGN